MTAPVLVVMGVAGAGKSTIGKALAERLGWPFLEGDSLHPPANVAKMHAGEPLTDADRWPWLEAIGAWIDAHGDKDQGAVIACSALKRAYRAVLRRGRPFVRIVYIAADETLVGERMEHRQGHYFPTSLIASQFETLEPPGADEAPITVAMGPPTAILVDQIVQQLQA
jgi:gluconokinase/6-phosphogluconolactonase